MAKSRKKKSNEKLAPKLDFSLVNTTRGILIAVGKPFYFLILRILIVLVFVPFTLGVAFRLSVKWVSRFLHKKKSKRKRVKKKIPKVILPQLKIPSPKFLVKLGGLKISLFKLKIISHLKKIFSLKITRFQKLKLGKKTFLLSFFIFMAVVFSSIYFFIFKDLPSPKSLSERTPEVSTKIYDRNGTLLYKIYKDQNRTIIPLGEIPQHVRLATLAAEDAEFYNHPGFSIKGILRALIQNAKTGRVQGGSTITQQLVKNTLLTSERTIIRKIKEVVLSIEVEANYTKDQILEMYMNEVSYGGTAYGIEEAARTYFGKDVGKLTLAEASLLASLPQSPTQLSPFGQNPELAASRQKEVLRLMRINKFITRDQEKEAQDEKIVFVQNKTEIKAPHFVHYIRQILVDKYGEELVEKGGLEVTTSLDLNIQEMSEKIVKEEVDKLKNLNVGNGAALILNPQNNEILGMVGSKNYFDTQNDGQVNVTTRLRQPGSSIKVVNYAYALSNGYNPASIIDDSPITYVVPGSSPYSPKNYDGEYVGKVSLRNALAQSRNIPAVKLLASYGVDKMIDLGEKMGITTWTERGKYGLSLTLGGGGVKLLDLAKVYSTIANEGVTQALTPILEIKDYKGRVIEKSQKEEGKQVLSSGVAYMLIDILKDNKARSPEFGLNSYLVVKNHPEVAVKTGTSNDLRDNLTAGFNQNFLVVTWVGNNDNSPMSRIASGVTGASPIWNKIMSTLLATQPSIQWEVPESVNKLNICAATGTLPCAGCPVTAEWFLKDTKLKSCTKNNEQQPLPIGPQILENGITTEQERI